MIRRMQKVLTSRHACTLSARRAGGAFERMFTDLADLIRKNRSR